MSWLTAVFLVAAGTIATLLGLALTAVIALLVRGALVRTYQIVARLVGTPRLANPS
ncbi:MAG: hypothetical protein KDI22_10605 [Gammaproteobacteria bacterium]|nr:hypothetical protein [Gammaproteobacteria bacterium]MCP5316898.1 hypothetical protein [Chromatiaceae bacterium]MCB1816520.1 hypothetical protein [Gammaproteobacteria bacterium]MCP5428825.1 hypothetical protein [Chromatiaceae bacterium]MCP5434430.1 hypothetical protein [Chromatiaceae bacterium]